MIAQASPLGPQVNMAGMQFFPVQHIDTFQGRSTTAAQTYRDYDVAMRNSMDNARMMRNDIGVMECLEARQRAVALLPWHIEPEDAKSSTQKQLAEEMTKILAATPRFTEMRRCLMEAAWYGKYAVQVKLGWDWLGGRRRVMVFSDEGDDVPRWLPINGDKLVFRHDDESHLDRKGGQYPHQLGIRVGGTYGAGSKIGRYTVEDVTKMTNRAEAVDRGRAYFVDKADRKRIIVHKHMIEDGVYEDYLSAGSIHGVGIRSRIYWDWVQKQDCLAFLIAYVERTHGGIEIYRYPAGNPQAEKEIDAAIHNRQPGRSALKVPVPMGEDAMAYGVEVAEPGMSGVDQLSDLLKNYFGHRIKRYILGQILSSEAEATGMGSGVADLHLESFLQIIKYDATNLEETLTLEFLRRLQIVNFPSSYGIRLQFKIDTQEADTDKKLQAIFQAWQMGARVKESDVFEVVGLSAPSPTDRVLSQQGGGGMPQIGSGQPFGNSEQLKPQGQPEQPSGDSGQFDVGEAGPPEKYARQLALWNEEEHPRDDQGRFTELSAGDRVPLRQAKPGGEVSDVDGKFYKGGQWLPVHGLHSRREKPEKKPRDSAEPTGRQPVARIRSQEEIDAQRNRDAERDEWSIVRGGPLGSALRLGELPHRIKFGIGDINKYADLVKHGEVSPQQFKAVVEYAQWEMRLIEDDASDEDWSYYVESVEDNAKDDMTYMPVKIRKVMSDNFDALLARRWIAELLHEKQDVATLRKIHDLLTGEQPEKYFRRDEVLRQSIVDAATNTDETPTEAAKLAGNYRKGKFQWNGLAIAIENPKGSIRRGRNSLGIEWENKMPCHYGYILKTESEADGDHIDVFVGPDPESPVVYVVDQVKGNGHFDEHKVMIGFTSEKAAREAYLASYSEGWNGLRSIHGLTIPQFQAWMEHGQSGDPIADQVSRYAMADNESQ